MLNGTQEVLLRNKANAIKEATGDKKKRLEKEFDEMYKEYDRLMDKNGQKAKNKNYF